MERAEILAVLETPDDLLEVDLLTDDEVEEILKKKGGIWCTPAVGISSGGSGACCEGPQYAESCLTDGGTPDFSCITPDICTGG